MKSIKINRADVFVPAFRMKACLTFILLLCASSAHSGDVFTCKDKTGHPIFTDINITGEWKCKERNLPPADSDKDSFSCSNKKGTTRYSGTNETGEWKCIVLILDSTLPRTQAKVKPRIFLSIGMSKEDVIKIWGKPIYKPSRTQTRNGITEKMTYPNGVLTFVNGTLEMIQN